VRNRIRHADVGVEMSSLFYSPVIHSHGPGVVTIVFLVIFK